MTDFAKSPAFLQPHVIYDPRQDAMVPHANFGAWPGLNIQQHVWLTLFAAHLSSHGDVSDSLARNWADQSLLTALERLKELA